MRSLFHLRWLAALACWLGSVSLAQATHILGGEITYSSIASTTAGIPRYHVVARLFRDPTKIDQPTLNLFFSVGDCSGNLPGSFKLNVNRTSVATSFELACLTNPLYMYNYQVLTFETDVDLPAGRWTISAMTENRLSSIVNVPSSINTDYAFSAVLDNTFFTQDASPKFQSTLLPYLLGDQMARYSFSAFDVDGDSLAYQFVLPQRSTSQFTAGCGFDIAGSAVSPHFTINPATGALTTTAGSVRQGYYSMVARVTEYRRVGSTWVAIGYVMRDISYLAYASINQSPRFTTIAINQSAAAPLTGQLIRVQRGQTLQLNLSATDPDAGQQLRFASQAPSVVPGLSLQTTGPTTAQLTWQVPASLPPGRYTLTVAVLDNGCPNASEEQTLTVLVTDQALAARTATQPAAEAYPVPFREQVQLRTQPGQAVTIVDALGRPVAQLRSGPDGRVQWQPAASLPAGLYLARAADGQLLARLLRE